jgi:hypothetical protein
VAYLHSRAMAYDSSKRLLLKALLKGLAHAIHRDDLSAAERYRERLHLTGEPLAADAVVISALKKLHLISGLWVQAADVERNETRQELLELIDHVSALLT